MKSYDLSPLRNLSGPIMLTGHTGFKGTWMSMLLQELGIPVVGFSLPPDPNSLYLRIPKYKRIDGVFGDIRNRKDLEAFIKINKPGAIIHLAAQPLVIDSYKNPLDTFSTNVQGTAELLDLALKAPTIKAVVVSTTDKVYRNLGLGEPFKETDSLGGRDPYSASKVGTESVLDAWREISRKTSRIPITSLRAGNVVGGGDLANNRLLPDLVRGFIHSMPVSIRNPASVRPWQHVLDPLWGYLLALNNSIGKTESCTPAYNFSADGSALTVQQVVNISVAHMPQVKEILWSQTEDSGFAESKILKLDSSLAREELAWDSAWTQEMAIASTMKWWSDFLVEKKDPFSICLNDIDFLLNSNRLKR